VHGNTGEPCSSIQGPGQGQGGGCGECVQDHLYTTGMSKQSGNRPAFFAPSGRMRVLTLAHWMSYIRLTASLICFLSHLQGSEGRGAGEGGG